jgi:fermentation-respiration switch protein FrsA (DUF1100 family)
MAAEIDTNESEPRKERAQARRLAFAALLIAAAAAFALTGKAMLDEFIERNFIFFPTESLPFTPRDWGMEFEDVYFTASDGVRLNAWLIDAGDDAPMVLWFHGNAGNIADRVDNARLLYGRGLSLFMIDYRGYGASEGRPSEKGINEDGLAAYDYLLERGVTPENLIVFGRSLGSTVAIHLACQDKCAGVILESAFTNMADMAKKHFPIVPGTGGFKLKFPSIDRIASIDDPILFIHGAEDEIVPYELGLRLFEAASAEKEFYTIEGAHHNDTYLMGGKEYFDKFEKFVRDKTGKTAPPSSER